jgi:hypothetical protein
MKITNKGTGTSIYQFCNLDSFYWQTFSTHGLTLLQDCKISLPSDLCTLLSYAAPYWAVLWIQIRIWIRIQWGSMDPYLDSQSGFRIQEGKNLIFAVVDGLFWGLKSSPVAWAWVNCNFWSKEFSSVFFSSVFVHQNPGSGSVFT